MNRPISRRRVLKKGLQYGVASAASASLGKSLMGQGRKGASQRTVVIMFDGFGPAYLAESKMPVLEQWKREGIYKQVQG
ncbi:MAG: hypothetical protein ACRD4Y_13600, partial [Candidatus Acidiferrales bacterium]